MKFLDFFKRQIQVARVSGIPVRIDYRWFAVFGVTMWLLATVFTEGSQRIEALEAGPAWAVAVLTTLLMFLSIFGHELSHALVGRTEGIETEEIVLHPFGGLARLRREPDNPRAEFRIAVAGPASSFIFAMVGFAAGEAARVGGWYTLRTMFVIIGGWNLMLAFFNILPGYPLDGGRVLRGYLWHRTGRMDEATRIASLGGQAIAWTLIVFGVYFFFKWGDLFMSASSILVGLFLRGAAASVIKGRGGKFKTAGEAMFAPVSIEPATLVSHFVDNVLPVHRQAAVPVAQGAQLHGILTLEDLKKLPRDRWHHTRVSEVMRPVDRDLFVNPSTPLARAEKLMSENGAGALAVVNGAGELVGFLLRGQLKRRVKSKA
ncbi:MAG TPA: site-2 protease family protein [Pyrinomonadaceae bacterium]|jgi:Zn-dependent protease|nr:site-2 protease family protein [Pyrinomonadaceae bacterium]